MSSPNVVVAGTTSVVVVSSSSQAPTTTSSMDIIGGGGSFRPEDKGSFFDFVSAPVTPTTNSPAVSATDRQTLVLQCNTVNNNGPANGNVSNSNDTTGSGTGGISTRNSNHCMSEASLNNGHDSANGITSASAIDHQQQQQQPLQGYDQFWGSDKDPNRLDAGVFEDLNRFCWTQQQQQQQPSNQATSNNNNNGPVSGFSTDGQIYTLTVLNGSEQWLKKEMTEPSSLPLDLETLLGGFPGYIKSEYSYEDSGFGTEKPDDLMMTHQQQHNHNHHHNPHLQQHMVGAQHPHSPLAPVTINNNNPSSSSNSTNLGAFHDPSHPTPSNNNSNTTSSNNSLASPNDWQMTTDHNHNSESTAESLLRSALQGKGYGKGPVPMQLQNGMTMIDSPTTLGKSVMFVTDQESLGYADSTLAAPMFDDQSAILGNGSNPNGLVTTSNLVHVGGVSAAHSTVHHHVDDDMFLSLDNAFSDDFEKIKRIATEVQQFCTNDVNNNQQQHHQQQDYPSLLHIDSNNNHSVCGTPLSPTKMCHSPLLLNLNGSPTTTTPTTLKGSGKVILGNSNGNACPSSPYLPQSPILGCVMTTGKGSPNIVTSPTSGGPQSISSSTGAAAPNKPKKYKRMSSSGGSNHSSNNNNNNNNNNNSSSCSNLNLVAGANGSMSAHHTSPCNGQRKERSLHYCSICSKGFKDKYSVNVHIRTHTGEKPFSCSLCGKSFRQKAHLAKHYQTHMAQKNNAGGREGSHSLKASKQQQQQQNLQRTPQQAQQQPIISSASSTIIPTGIGVMGQSQVAQQLIGGMGPEVANLVTANP